jgi:ketosteroid isomerase-like protein
MERESRADFVSPEVSQTSADADRTLTSPVFDENSIHHARPAVPLQATARVARPEGGWSPSLIALAVAAGIVGGIIGIFAINFYQRRAAQSSPAQLATTTSASSEQTAPANGAAKNDTSATTTTTTNTRAVEQTTQAPVSTSKGDAGATEPPASSPVAASPASRSDQGAKNDQSAAASGGDEQELRAALDEWIAATNARDIDRQMKFYEPTVAAFYLTRNASREAVRAEKANVFARASTVDVRADEPQISVSPDGQTATMRFRKQYAIVGGGSDRRGAVIQELRWRRTGAGWRITSERDLRVVN